MKKLFTGLALLALVTLASACLAAPVDNPTMLGLEVGKSTTADIQALRPTPLGQNKVTGGPSFDLDVDILALNDLQVARVAFDVNGKLVGIFLRFGADAYTPLANMMGKIYPGAESSQVAKYGVRAISTVDGSVKVELVGSSSQRITALSYLDINYLP